MPDCTQHHVLFIQQRGDPRFQCIVRGNQLLDVGRSDGDHRIAGIAGCREVVHPPGQRFQGPGQPLQDQGNRADQQGIDHQRLDQQSQQGTARRGRHQHPRDGPGRGGIPAHGGDDHGLGQATIAAAPQPSFKAPLGNRIGAGVAAQDLDGLERNALVGEDRAQRCFLLGQPQVLGLDRRRGRFARA